MANDFAWLHISDLHAGQDNQDWLWPQLKARFYEDIRRIQPQFEKLDLVIFSGDLTQSGSKEDFALLEDTLNRLWEELATIGSTPALFLVPGNHDLERPPKYDSRAIAMKSWWTNPDVKEAFWKTSDNEFREFVRTIFSQYTEFTKKLEAQGFPVIKTKAGTLPGDCSALIAKDNLKLGLIGLNTSYLHFFDDGTANLDLDPRQLLGVTDNQPDEWCRANDLNFLITHHPSNWLHKNALPHFHGEIYTPDRFTAHLFGHMHLPDYQSSRNGGSAERRHIQAASLFGLRKIEGQTFERLHGYSASTINIGAESAKIRVWPRIGEVVGSGVHRFVPNTKLDLEEGNFFEIEFKRNNPLGKQESFALSSDQLTLRSAQEQAAIDAHGTTIDSLFTQLRAAPNHAGVRTLEQKKLQLALQDSSAAWIVADWNYAVDEFIWATLQTTQSKPSEVFRFSLSEYKSREDFLSQFSQETGKSFQEFSKSIINKGNILFLLDDAPTDRGATGVNEHQYESELESIVEAFRDYCPNSNVILIARNKPVAATLPIIEVGPFEEPDVRTYILQHRGSASQYGSSTAISEIYGLTDGIPTELDLLIKQLEFVSLQEIIQERLSYPKGNAEQAASGEAIAAAIEELRVSEDPEMNRAFGLLRALSVLPHGETLMRIKHFNAPHPFHHSHASILADRGFIEIQVISPTIATKADTPKSPRLRVKKTVREEVLKPLSSSEIYQLNRKAASVYFGEEWLQGKPRNIKTADLIEALGGGGLGNPHAVINALLQHTAEIGEASKLKQTIDLARLLVANLDQANHFRAALACCKDFIKLIPETKENLSDINWLRFKLAVATRMIGDRTGSAAIFSEMDLSKFDKPTRLKILINWAMAEQISNPAHAIELARKIITLGKATFQAMEAEALILQISPEEPDRFIKLRALEKKARGKKAITAANNIALFLNHHSNESPNEKRANLRDVAVSARKYRDAYSAARATIRIGRLIQENKLKPTPEEISGMIATYLYLYQERLSDQFTDSHEILWHHFLNTRDLPNLFRLYRHSSFVWRLNGDDQREAPYATALAANFTDLQAKIRADRSIEADYFSIRAEKFQLALTRN